MSVFQQYLEHIEALRGARELYASALAPATARAAEAEENRVLDAMDALWDELTSEERLATEQHSHRAFPDTPA